MMRRPSLTGVAVACCLAAACSSADAQSPSASTAGQPATSAQPATSPTAGSVAARYLGTAGEHRHVAEGSVYVAEFDAPVDGFSFDSEASTTATTTPDGGVLLSTRFDERFTQDLSLAAIADDLVIIGVTFRRTNLQGVVALQTVVPQPPVPLLRLPATAGDTWTLAWTDVGIGAQGSGQAELVAVEPVELAGSAGETREAYHVRIDQELTGAVTGSMVWDLWLATDNGDLLRRISRDELNSAAAEFRNDVDMTLMGAS